MRYKTFKISDSIEVRAKHLSMSVNEYFHHLIRVTDEHNSLHAENTFNKVEQLEKSVSELDRNLKAVKDAINLLAKKSGS